MYTDFVYKSLIDDEGINGKGPLFSGKQFAPIVTAGCDGFFLLFLFSFFSSIFAECRGGVRDDDKCDYEYAISARDFGWRRQKKKIK